MNLCNPSLTIGEIHGKTSIILLFWAFKKRSNCGLQFMDMIDHKRGNGRLKSVGMIDHKRDNGRHLGSSQKEEYVVIVLRSLEWARRGLTKKSLNHQRVLLYEVKGTNEGKSFK